MVGRRSSGVVGRRSAVFFASSWRRSSGVAAASWRRSSVVAAVVVVGRRVESLGRRWAVVVASVGGVAGGGGSIFL